MVGFDKRCEVFFQSDKAQKVANYFLDELESHMDPSLKYITDTTPSNFRYIGFIKILFPNAKIIYCQRDALDQCLQIYMKYFVRGHKYSNNLNVLGEYYVYYLKMMAHWKNVLGDSILTIDYESLVQNRQQETKRIIEYLALENYPDTLELEFVDREIGRWRHFEHHLEPIKRALGL